MSPRIGSLFSGYGGLDMAVQNFYGGELAWYSEIDKHANTILAAHYPQAPNLGDIKTIKWGDVSPVDILTGGYPCQPFSQAGARKGKDDERHLWPYVRDAIAALRPMVTVLENVDGHRSLGFADVLADIADMGMSARWGVIRAADAGAPHGRKRIFIIITDADNARWGEHSRAFPIKSQFPSAQYVSDIATDADITGSKAWIDTGLNGQCIRVQSLGHSDITTDADSDGHGEQLHAGGMGSMEGAAAGGASERQRTRAQSDAGGDFAVTNANGDRRGKARRTAKAQADRSSGADSGCHRISAGLEWGRYGPAISRWEQVSGRSAPEPTISGANGRPRLSPIFVEWMMGLPAGHVTGFDFRPAACLKILGNGVVPQQALLALRMLESTR